MGEIILSHSPVGRTWQKLSNFKCSYMNFNKINDFIILIETFLTNYMFPNFRCGILTI